MSLERPNRIEYRTPAQTEEEDRSPQHTFDCVVDGVKVGGAEVDYFSKPLPLYQVTDLYVDPEHKGKGFASQILAQVEEFLREKKKPGVLVDAIMFGDPASGMYERRGWQKVPDTETTKDLYVFNWPENVSITALIGYPQRYTEYLERESRAKNVRT